MSLLSIPLFEEPPHQPPTEHEHDHADEHDSQDDVEGSDVPKGKPVQTLVTLIFRFRVQFRLKYQSFNFKT